MGGEFLKKKILFTIDNLNYGGAEKILVDTVNHLDPQKYDITVLAIQNEGVYIDKLNPNVKYKFIVDKNHPQKNKWFYRALNRLPLSVVTKLYIKEKFDVEVAFLEGFTTKLIGSSNKRSTKIAWVHTDMQAFPYADRFFKDFKQHKETYETFDKIVCVSETAKQQFVKKFGLVDKVIARYNPLDKSDIRTRSNEVVTDIEKSKRFKIVSVGRLAHPKGYDRLLTIHKQLIYAGFDHELWIIGEGSRRSQLEKYISENDLYDSVKLLGFKKNPYKYVRECDLFVCSSRAEGFSLAIAEAFVLGVPVVSVDCTGPNELLEYGKYGLLTENNNLALYEGIKLLLSDKSKYNYYKRQAEIRGNYFSLKKSIKEIEEVLD